MIKLKIRLLIVLSAILLVMTSCGEEMTEVQVLNDPDLHPEYLSFFSSQSLSDSDVSKFWRDRFTEKYNKEVYIDFDVAAYYADAGLSYRELLEKRLESSAPDDLYIIKAEDVLEFEKRGYWMDLSDMDFVANLSDAALNQSTYNGKVFSVPLTFTGYGFIWNVDMLKKYDLSIPHRLDDFLNVCEVLKNNGILPYGANKGFSLTIPAMCIGLSELYRSTDRSERIDSLNNGETPISQYMRKGYEFLSMMIDNEYLDPDQALATTPNMEFEEFFNGKYAFICAGLSNFYSITESPFSIEMTGLPILEDGCISVYGADKRLCINPGSQHLETAMQFIEMVGSTESLNESAKLDRTLSSAKESNVKGPPGSEKLVELLKRSDQIPNQDFSLHFNTWESIRDVARELCKGTDINQALALLDQKQQADLSVYGE